MNKEQINDLLNSFGESISPEDKSIMYCQSEGEFAFQIRNMNISEVEVAVMMIMSRIQKIKDNDALLNLSAN